MIYVTIKYNDIKIFDTINSKFQEFLIKPRNVKNCNNTVKIQQLAESKPEIAITALSKTK